MQNIENDFSQNLRTKKLKITAQRVGILNEIYQCGHSSIEEIYTKIRDTIPNVSLATVYKNILSMQDANIIRVIRTPTGRQKYEIVKQPHCHLFCKKCEDLEDLYIDTNAIYGASMERYAQIDDVSIIISGVCKKCKNAEIKTLKKAL